MDWDILPCQLTSQVMGRVWERMIGVACRILYIMLCKVEYSQHIHEALETLMAEVTAIINARLLPQIQTCQL